MSATRQQQFVHRWEVTSCATDEKWFRTQAHKSVVWQALRKVSAHIHNDQRQHACCCVLLSVNDMLARIVNTRRFGRFRLVAPSNASTGKLAVNGPPISTAKFSPYFSVIIPITDSSTAGIYLYNQRQRYEVFPATWISVRAQSVASWLHIIPPLSAFYP